MLLGWIALALLLDPRAQESPVSRLGELERESGWVSMSDESSQGAWDAPVEGWTFEGPLLRRAAHATAYLGWKEVLSDFEIDFDWRDHQAADNAWHRGRVVMRADNSGLALIAEQRIDRARDSDKPSFRAGPFEMTPAQSKPGWHIALMPGESEFEVRGMRLRDRSKPIGTRVELFDGKTLKGWRPLGDAKFTVENGELIGEVGGGSQSFLRTNQSFGDFILELDVKNELPGNSGIQVRSHENDQKRLFGYQIEIDPSARAWSGGLYDEARRGWLDDLSDNPHGRAAFKNGEWNHYRIECIGPWIRAWVNDVPTADYLDAQDLEGVVGLQVHAGKDTKVRWRDFRVRDLGRSRWKPLSSEPGPQLFRDDTDNYGHGAQREDWILLARGGGDVRLEYERFDHDRPAFLERLQVIGEDWTITVPLRELNLEHSRILVLCHPPRVAVEIDGRRLPDPVLEVARREQGMPAELHVLYDEASSLQRAELIDRE
jgi:hypothetical protein